ncbi:unnamed protein product [Chrysodeixis includens]|uniref:Uncharacterized protein n=1 Tax=Chrysodeixis includens TaxID=689277 RepID=A0A9N8L1X1_CHRIL|nr:unnamed protein product [Chrysodeixis includens]
MYDVNGSNVAAQCQRAGTELAAAGSRRARAQQGGRRRRSERSADAAALFAYRFSYLIVVAYERARDRVASVLVLSADTVRRSRRVRAGSVICGGRSWARGAAAAVRVRGVARRAGHCPPAPSAY